MSADTSGTTTEQPGGVDAPFAKNGKVSYMQIPARDVAQSGAFYVSVFGWTVPADSNPTHRSFQDGSGELLGAFVTERAAAPEPGVLPYIYVDRIDATVREIEAHGGQMVRAVYPEGDLWVAAFRDPAGNVMGVWQGGPR
jgi:predicted enzyme related to lactoylglutathione lyase